MNKSKAVQVLNQQNRINLNPEMEKLSMNDEKVAKQKLRSFLKSYTRVQVLHSEKYSSIKIHVTKLAHFGSYM